MRTLTRWEPMSEMANTTRGFDRMFDELMGRGLRRVFNEGAVRGTWTPARQSVSSILTSCLHQAPASSARP